MELITTIAAPNANSYVTVAEADELLSARDGFELEGWEALTEEQKAIRLFYGARVLDSLNFRGQQAVTEQSMAFPRLFSIDYLLDRLNQKKMRCATWPELTDFASFVGASLPVIPDDVKLAQVEITFQVIHSSVISAGAFEAGESPITSLKIDAIQMSFGSNTKGAYELFSKADFGSASTIKMLLQKYLTTMRSALV